MAENGNMELQRSGRFYQQMAGLRLVVLVHLLPLLDESISMQSVDSRHYFLCPA